MSNQTAFLIKDVALQYGDLSVLKTINVSIKKNQVTALIGPSGCGKSTLLRTLNRLNYLIIGCKMQGEILYQGTNIKEMNPAYLRLKVGMVFQKPNPFPMSIYDNVAYGPRCQGIKKKEVLDALVIDALKQAALYEEVKDRLKESAFSLSGGQQQRLCIARSICLKPDVILMDEPTSGLDPVFRSEILEILKEYIEEGERSVLFSTHITTDLEKIADYVTFINDGQMVFSTDKDNILDQYAIVKGGLDLLNEEFKANLVGLRKNAFGFEGLTNKKDQMKNKFKETIMIEKASLEDIMVYTVGGIR